MDIASKILAVLAVIAVLTVVFFAARSRPISVTTDQSVYRAGGALEVGIKNNFNEPICFSSCYPYLMEKEDKSGNWEMYAYMDCPKPDQASDCVAAGSEKKFRLPLQEIETGQTRLKIPVCVGCAAGQPFKASDVLYSNSFEIQ
jgi:hypothetical protein